MAPAEQADQIRGCTTDEARLAAAALAGLHGPRWCDPAWLSFTGTVMPKPDEPTARGLGDITRLAARTTVDKLGPQMDPADRATVLESAEAIADWLVGSPERFSLLHGDYRADNLLFDPDRTRVTVVDWQTLAVGLPARDLSYFLATSLSPTIGSPMNRNWSAFTSEPWPAMGCRTTTPKQLGRTTVSECCRCR